jgi:hypothetical protein
VQRNVGGNRAKVKRKLRESRSRREKNDLADLHHVLRFRTLLAVDDVELDSVAFGEAAEALGVDGSVVDEDVGAGLTNDEGRSPLRR